MRKLKFNVEGQKLKKHPNCNFENIETGTKNYLTAEFNFSNDWNGFVKVASFCSVLGKEYSPAILKDGKSCIIPEEVLNKRKFGIQIVGKKEDIIIKTNKIFVSQGV